MPFDAYDYNNFSNCGFNITPQYTGFADKTPGQALTQGLYYYANAANNSEYAEKAREIFGHGIMPIDSPNTNYFVGRAMLERHGYLNSPWQYFIQNKLPIPETLTDDASVYEHVGKQVMQQMRDSYQRNQQIEQQLKTLNENMPDLLSRSVRAVENDVGTLWGAVSPEALSVLAENGRLDKISASVQKAREAWLLVRAQYHADARGARAALVGQATNRAGLTEIANALSDETGNIDEMALLAFRFALEDYAKEIQPEGVAGAETGLLRWFMQDYAGEDERIRQSWMAAPSEAQVQAFQNAIAEGKTEEEALAISQATRRDDMFDARVNSVMGAMRSAARESTSSSDRASLWRAVLTEAGNLVGEMAVPAIVATASAYATRTAGLGTVWQVGATGLGTYATLRDPSVNESTMRAYLEGVTNPELYGKLEGESSAFVEGMFNSAGTFIASWKVAGNILRRTAAAATVRSGLVNRPWLRTALSYAGVTATETLSELTEEELSEALGWATIQIAHDSGTDISLKQYEIGDALAGMRKVDIAAIGLFAAITGAPGVPANYRLARQLAKDKASLTRFFGNEGANKIAEAALVHEVSINDILASGLSEEAKQRLIREAEAAFVSFLGTELEEQVLNNPEAALANIEADDKRLISEEAARLLMQSQAAVMGLRQHGIMGATPNGDGTYDLTFQVKNKEGEPQLVHRTWNEQQLVNFLRLQADTKLHQDIMSYQSVLSANEYAKALSPEQIGASLVSIMETKAASIFMEHGGVITEDFIKALAEAVSQDADIFPYLSETQLNDIAAAMSKRKKNAMATTEGKELGINEDTKVIFPALNIRKPEGSYIIAYAAGQTRLADFMEELFEVDIKQRIESGKTTLEELEAALTKIEERMPGITLLERKDGKVTQNAIVEAYSKLAQANLLTNIANLQTLSPAEKEVLTDTISVMRKGKLIQTLAGAWKTYTAENAANADANIDKLINIMEEAGFSFGERFQGTLTAANHRMQVMEALGFADFEQQAQEIAEGAAAQDEATIANVQEQADVTPEEQQEHAVKAGYDPESGELATNGQLTHIDEKTGREATRNMDGSVTITINPNQIFVADVLKDTPIIKANFDASGQEIVAIRDDAGKLHAVSGISQLQNAKEQGINFTKVTIFDNFKAWSNDNIIAYNAYQNIISGQGLTQDYTNFFRYSKPMSDAEAMEAGVCTYTTDGTPTPSYILGKQRSVFVNDQYSKSGKWPSDVLTGEVKVSRITLSPEVKQFKTTKAGREADSRGVVYELPGEYRPHDPIHLWHRRDGTLIVISGRHRLAKAIEAGAENILATVFPETESRDARWARIHDFEQNVMDNQASVSDVAVYVQGYNPMARKLTEEETAQFNRPKSNAEKGINIGLHGSTDVLNYLATGSISDETADKIVSFAPDDVEVQRVALGVFLESGSILEALDAARIYKETRDMKSGNLFASLGSEQRKEAFAKFLAKYAANKRRELGVQKNLRKGAKDSKSVKRIEEAGLSFDDVDKRRGEYNEYSVKQDAWRNLSTHPELIAEAKEAFDNTAEGQQQYFNFGEFDESQQQGGFLDLGGSYSIASADDIVSRFEGNTLAERMANFIKRESKRLSKVLTFAPNTETATKAIADVTAIMHSLDKYVENGTFHISESDRKTLRMLVRLADKYGEMIYKGKFRSLKKADKETAERFKAEVEAIAHEEAIKEQQRKVKFHLKNKDSALKKAEAAKTEEERQKCLKLADKHQQLADAREESVAHDDFLAARHKIAAQMAEGNAKEVVETMLNEAGDLLERYLKADISNRINKLLDQIRPKRSATKRFKGKLHASSYRRIDEIIEIMGMSKAAKDSELDAIHYAKQALEHGDTPPKGTFPVLDTIREKLGDDASTEDIIEALNKREADVLTFGCIDGMTYQQAREAFNAFYLTLRMRRTAWEWKQEMEKNKINSIIYDFFGVDPSNLDEAELDVSKLGTDQNLRDLKDKLEKAKFTMPDSYMNAAQLFYALSSFKGLEGVFSDFMYKLSNNKIARELHLSGMRKKELRAFAAIKGMKPANSEEGFSDKELKGKVAAKFDDFFEANNKRVKTGITHTYTKKIKGVTGEVTEELELTKWEALDLILQYRQDDYKSNAESYGFTQDVMQKLEDFCGKDLMAFGNYIQQAIVNDGTVPVYEARTGVPMKENPKYFPSSANINTLNITSKEPLVNPQTGINPFGWQKERVKHDEELKASNAYTKYRLALTSRANYVYFEPITHTLERLLADKTFANGLHKAIGSQLFGQLIETINEIKGAAWQETVMQDVNNDKIMKAFATHALLTLPMKVTTLLRQLTSVANAGMLPGLNVVTCLPHIAGVFWGGGHKTFFDILLNLPAFESRKRDNAFVNELMNMGNDATFSRALILARKGMDWIDRWDLCANAFSATVVYNHKYAQLEKQGGLSVTEMEKLAEQEVNLYLALLAQPLSRLDKSALYWRWSQNVLGRAFMYMGSESIQKVGMARAAYIVNKNNGDGGVKNWTKLIVKTGLSIGTASFLVGLANALIRGETPDEDDNMLAWYLATFLSESVGQYTDYLPAVGPIIDTALSPYAGWGEAKERIPGISAITHGTKLYTMLTDDKDYSPAEWEMQLNRFNTELVPAFSALGYGTYSPLKWFSMATSALTSLNAIGNLIYPFARGASNNAAWLPILPESLEELINKDDTRKPRRRKSLAERKIERLLD